MPRRQLVPLALFLAALAGCDGAEMTAPDTRPDVAQLALSTVAGVTEVTGETGPGSTYALFVPVDWNGSLVVYAHGYIQPFLDPMLPDEPLLAPVRDALLGLGYAFAYSSWSETGYAVKDGAQRTHQLNGLFAEQFRKPDRTYLWGLSLGGLVAEMLSERFASQYDGTLATCGVMGGGGWNAEYVAHFRVLFDYFYPGVLEGSLYAVPEGYLVIGPDPARGYPGSPAFQALYGALSRNPFPAMQMASIEQIGLEWNGNPTELIMGFIHVLGYQVNGANALTERLHGHGFFDNMETWYSGSADDPAVTAAVERYSGDPAAEKYLDHWWEPAGLIERPFITLHTTRDPLVPARTEAIFAERVSEAGRSSLLLQRTTDAFGHCYFQPHEILGAFSDLVDWVETGAKPAH